MMTVFKAAVVQAAPEFMNIKAGVDKAIALIEQAASAGAELIAFPECWLPGYPFWGWLSAPAHNIKYFKAYHENCMVLGDEHYLRLSAAARDNNIMLSMGFSERDHGTLYIAQILLDNNGELLQTRRKLKATHMERTVFGEGDGSDFNVLQTELGRLGQLCCWEHINPLNKYAMYSMHEQVHIAAWPSFSCYPQSYSLGPELNNSLSQVYAAEGQCFVLAPCGVVSQAMLDVLIETEEHAELLTLGGGAAQIYAPNGRPMCDPLAPDEDGLLFADIDLSEITVAKCFADPVGHYSRSDVLSLNFNRKPLQAVLESGCQTTYVEDLVEDSNVGAPLNDVTE